MTDRPRIPDLERIMRDWTVPEMQAFLCCIRSKQDAAVPDSREEIASRCIEELFWAYNSKTRAGIKSSSSQATKFSYEFLRSKIKGVPSQKFAPPELCEFATELSYDYLLKECCKHLKIEDPNTEETHLLEVYLYEALIARAAVAMTAKQRHQFFTQAISIDGISAGSNKIVSAGPATTLAALAAAQASGFGVYLGATTALGLLSHAVGITLPFAIYTGMTSTIGFLIGPPGFLAAGLWWAWKGTGPDWERIERALLHIVIIREKHRLFSKQLTD